MNMRNVLPLFQRSTMYIKMLTNNQLKSHFASIYNNKFLIIQRKLTTTSVYSIRITRDDVESDNEADLDYENKPSYSLEMEGYARDMLRGKAKDILLTRIYNCLSIQELFTLLNKNMDKCNSEHLTQSVLVLYDLKRIYDDINHINISCSTKISKEFLEKLENNNGFQNLLLLIENKINTFDSDLLSYVLLYLIKLGMNIEDPLLQLLSHKLESKLIANFSISPASRYLEAVFTKVQLRSYFMSQNLIPLTLKQIDSCHSVDTLNDLTVSLNKLHNVVTEELLDKYKQKIENFITNRVLTSKSYKVILQIIAFLNYPKWRDKNCVLMSKSILLLQNNVDALNVNEIILLYEIFFKIQEPGEILSELQRCSSRHYHHLDDLVTAPKITLLSTIIYFASPNHRNEFQSMLEMYVKNCNDFDNLLLLRKLLSHIKVADIKLCHLYWDKLLNHLKKDLENIDVLKLCQNYMNFTVDIENFRHKELETEVLKILKNLMKDVNYKFFPQKLANILSFVLIFSNDIAFLEYLVDNLEKNWVQLRHTDCLKLALSLRLFNGVEKKYIKLAYAQRIDNVLNKIIQEKANKDKDLYKHNALLRSCIFKNNTPPELLDRLLNDYTNFKHVSSKNIENILYCLHVTNSLIPEVLDSIVKYMIQYKEHILGFNISKTLYLMYNLGYHPKNSEEFFKVVVDIITRDQERMTGLTLIHCALGLCFFNSLPNSLIKTVFNVEFMDKLDSELQNCYSKDKYPQRVRYSLMCLNRAVCLDYPECNVPWFHQKYVEEHIKIETEKRNIFANKVREYLIKAVSDKGIVEEAVVTPYGYKVDFVVNLGSQQEAFSDSKKIALLLIPEFYYTRMCVNLKGPYQLKRRHLEMLGYKVITLDFKEWIDLFYAGERISFLTDLIWPKQIDGSDKTVVS